MAAVAAIPAPDKGWLLVSGERELGQHVDLHALVGKRGDVTIGVPASLSSTFPVALPSTDASLHASMIFAQAEKRGLTGAGEGNSLIDYDLLDHEREGDTFAVSVVEDLPPDLVVKGANGYATSAMLRPKPKGGCRLWQEWGRFVLAIYSDGLPLHVQVLSGEPQVNAATAQEVSLIFLSLRGDPVMEDRMPSSMELSIPGVSPEVAAEFSHALDMPVTVVEPSSAVESHLTQRDKLIPLEVTRHRRKKKAGKRTAAILTAAFIVYCVAAVWIWVKSRNTAAEVRSLERQISIVEPDVEHIQQVEQRWKRLEPAFEKSWFPLVQLSRITSALPGSGVVVREFRTSGRSIRVTGQARDVQLANRLLEDLQAMEEFSSYNWTMPNPKVEKNNTATFVISGEPKNAGADS